MQPNKGWTYWGYLNPEEDKLDKPYVYNNNEKKNDKDGDSKAYTDIYQLVFVFPFYTSRTGLYSKHLSHRTQ